MDAALPNRNKIAEQKKPIETSKDPDIIKKEISRKYLANEKDVETLKKTLNTVTSSDSNDFKSFIDIMMEQKNPAQILEFQKLLGNNYTELS